MNREKEVDRAVKTGAINCFLWQENGTCCECLAKKNGDCFINAESNMSESTIKGETKMKNRSGFVLMKVMILLAILAVVAALAFAIIAPPMMGVFPFGPESNVVAKVDRLYVDYSGGKDSSSSHYMVGTDVGVFEVNNSIWLWMWDADKRYAKIKEGGTYKFRVKGSEVLGLLFQEYRGIISVEQVE